MTPLYVALYASLACWAVGATLVALIYVRELTVMQERIDDLYRQLPDYLPTLREEIDAQS